METRQQNIDQRNARREARKLGEFTLAAELVAYGHAHIAPPHAETLANLWPIAWAYFDGLRHGRPTGGFQEPQVKAVYKLANKAKTAATVGTAAPSPSPLPAKSDFSELASHGKGIGWGHYPILKEGQKTGCKVTFRVKSGAAVAKRTLIPVSKEHAAIVRKCNQLIVEADQGTLYLASFAPDEWKVTKRRWEREHGTVRYLAIPQLYSVIVVHDKAEGGAAELGALCEGYGKAALYDLVGEWLAGRPSITKKTAKWGLIFAYVRVGNSKGWGKHYSGAKGKSKNIKANTALAAHSTHPSSTLAAAVRGTVDANGRGSDMTTSVKADMETFLQLGLIPTLTAEQLDTMNELEAVLIAAAAVPTVADELFSTVDTAAKSYTLTHETTAAPSPLPAKNGRPSRLRPSHGGASC